MILGLLLAATGVASAGAMPIMLGVSLVVVGAVPLARAAGMGERTAFTAAGLFLVVFWLLPFDWIETLAGRQLTWGFSIFILGGIFVVLGSAWTLIFNADVLLGGLVSTVGRLRGLAPVLKMAIAYPLRNRFRTGVTLAMFTLVVFTLVVGAVASGSFIAAMDNVERFGGGFDIRAEAAPTNPVSGMKQGSPTNRASTLHSSPSSRNSRSWRPRRANSVATRRGMRTTRSAGSTTLFSTIRPTEWRPRPAVTPAQKTSGEPWRKHRAWRSSTRSSPQARQLERRRGVAGLQAPRLRARGRGLRPDPAAAPRPTDREDAPPHRDRDPRGDARLLRWRESRLRKTQSPPHSGAVFDPPRITTRWRAESTREPSHRSSSPHSSPTASKLMRSRRSYRTWCPCNGRSTG